MVADGQDIEGKEAEVERKANVDEASVEKNGKNGVGGLKVNEGNEADGEKEGPEEPDEDTSRRKRSKSLRACDSCRRKKVRCNAEYCVNTDRISKKCDNCAKNNDECTFSRIPLKRGPSKSIGESEKFRRADFQGEYDISTRKNSLKVDGKESVSLPGPTIKFASNEGLVLPHMNSTGSHHGYFLPTLGAKKPPKTKSNPSSPGANVSLHGSLAGSAYDHKLSRSFSLPSEPGFQTPASEGPLKGPFWKVPYQMPSRRRSSSSGSGQSFHSRKLFSDSVSSNTSNGSRFALPSLKQAISCSSDIEASEDDGYYSAGSLRNSVSLSLSPRNSNPSLTGLGNRFNRDLTIGQPPIFSGISGQLNPGINRLNNLDNQINGIHQNFYPPSDMKVQPQQYFASITPIEELLRIYYRHFHFNICILPYKEDLIINIFHRYENDYNALPFLDLFYQSLLSLVNFDSVSMDILINIIFKISQLYSYDKNKLIDDNMIILTITSLVLINYTILLKGEFYSFAISITFSILNDFKVLQKFVEMISGRTRNTFVDPDEIHLFLPKAYFCLSLIANVCSLGSGTESLIPGGRFLDLLYKHLPEFIPTTINNYEISTFSLSWVILDLLIVRDQLILDSNNREIIRNCIKNWFSNARTPVKTFSRHFMVLLCDKYEFVDFIYEVEFGLKRAAPRLTDDEEHDLIDYHSFRLTRLIRKLVQSINDMARGLFSVDKAVAELKVPQDKEVDTEIGNPIINLAVLQSYKLLRIGMLITEVFLNWGSSSVSERCTNLRKDLMETYNLLNEKFLPVRASMPLLMKRKVENVFADMQGTAKHDGNVVLWKNDFLSRIMPLVASDNFDGWY